MTNRKSAPGTELGEVVEAAMARYRVPGVAVGIWHAGVETLAAFGVANVEDPSPVDADTLFQIGSLTKPAVATAAMRLVERGLVELDAPVMRYLPGFRLADPVTAERITVRQLFQHVAGFDGDRFDDFGRGDDALARYVESLEGQAPLFPLGTNFAYNNAALCVAGRVMEIAAGDTFEGVMRRELFGPLGMERTFFFPEELLTYRIAAGHNVDPEAGPLVVRPWAIPRSCSPAGGIVSTARDVLRFARFHLDDGASESGERVLRPESMELLHTPQMRGALPGERIGLAWHVADVGGVRFSRHGGAGTGQRALLIVSRSRGFALCVLSNADRGGELAGAVAARALREHLGLAPEPPARRTLPPDRQQEFAGMYRAPLSDVEVLVEGDGLVLREHRKRWITEVDRPMAQPGPTRLAFLDCPGGEEVVLALDEPFMGSRAEFLRDERGHVAWLRWGGRLMRRDPIGLAS